VKNHLKKIHCAKFNLRSSLAVWVDKNVSEAFKKIITQDERCMHFSSSPETADVILFENDAPSYIRQTFEFINWPHKCIVISETDKPTYFIPSLYASNCNRVLASGRAYTIPYVVSIRYRWNKFIDFQNGIKPLSLLYSFCGASTSWVRKKLFKKYFNVNSKDFLIRCSNDYFHWDNRDKLNLSDKENYQKQYAASICNSQFVLCPKGAGASSIRLFEVMQSGRVPVIISDSWIPISGIDWNECAVFIRESEISLIDRILRENQPRLASLSLNARKNWVTFFSAERDIWLLRDLISNIQIKRNDYRERIIRFVFPVISIWRWLIDFIRGIIKILILRIFHKLNIPFPYVIHRPIEEQLFISDD